MMELEKKVWDDFVDTFTDRLKHGYSIEVALKYFIEDYWSLLDGLSNEALREDDEEPLDVFFERKMKPMWDYVYNLQKQVNSLESRCPQKYGLSTDSKVYPNWNSPQPTMCDANGAVGSAGDGGSGPGFATSGYMQVVDQKYTPEQLEEWSKIRFDVPSERR